MEFDRIMELIFAISESELTEFEYRGNDVELCMRKESKERKRQRDIPDPDKPSLETEKKRSLCERRVSGKITDGGHFL